jgi:hypothetical protein
MLDAGQYDGDVQRVGNMMRRDVDFEPLEDIFLDHPQEIG